jgi:hypothetical protein
MKEVVSELCVNHTNSSLVRIVLSLILISIICESTSFYYLTLALDL